MIQGEWLSADHSPLSPAGPAESPEVWGPGLCGPGETGGRHQDPGGARDGGDQPGGCSLLPQVWFRNVVHSIIHVSLSSATSSTRVGQIFPRTDDGILSWLSIREPKQPSKVYILNNFII